MFRNLSSNEIRKINSQVKYRYPKNLLKHSSLQVQCVVISEANEKTSADV